MRLFFLERDSRIFEEVEKYKKDLNTLEKEKLQRTAKINELEVIVCLSLMYIQFHLQYTIQYLCLAELVAND